MSPQQEAWWWQTPVIFSLVLHCCWWPEWSQARSELSLQHFPNVFCTCLSVLYSEVLSMSLTCILSSIFLMPFLLFPYGLLYSLPGIPYSIFLHLPLSPTLILLSLQGPFAILLITPPVALPVIPVDFDSSSTLSKNDPNTSHPFLPISLPLQTCVMHSSGLYFVQCDYLDCINNIKPWRLQTTCRQLS